MKESLVPAGSRVLNGSGSAVWHKTAPQLVRRALRSGNHARGWQKWKAHLATRKRPTDPLKLLSAEAAAQDWAIPDGIEVPIEPAWLRQADALLCNGEEAPQSLESELLCWLGESAGTAADVRLTLETIASGRAVARLAAILSPDVWWALLDHLLATATDAAAIELEDDPLVHQLLRGELSLTLAYVLPEITFCRRLKLPARQALSKGLVDLLDGGGLPHGSRFDLLWPLLACWTRCRAIGDTMKGGCWNKAAEGQYEWLVRQAMRLIRHDGSQVFSEGTAGAFNEQLFATALRLGGDDDDRRIAAFVLPSAKKTGHSDRDMRGLPRAATHSEWAATAVLRPDWLRSSQRLTVLYPGWQYRMELGCGSDLLWSGQWELEVTANGRTATPDSDWEQLCWFSDGDVDFLEVEIHLSGGIRVQRQALLARQDRFLLLADIVLGAGSGNLQYRSQLPLCPDVKFREADESREGYLVARKRRALVLPLALPEWQAEPSTGILQQTPEGLQLHQSTEADRLYASLWFDLDRRRMVRRRTWRQLTVAESLAVLPTDVAVGYRVAVGKAQWLVYRTLAEKANRTLLGHNLSTEMLVARFRRSGKVEPLLEIE